MTINYNGLTINYNGLNCVMLCQIDLLKSVQYQLNDVTSAYNRDIQIARDDVKRSLQFEDARICREEQRLTMELR